MKRYQKLSTIFNYFELCTIENALNKYDSKNMTEEQKKAFENLKQTITAARGWNHQFGRFER